MKRIRKTSCVFVALALQAMACSAETNGPDDPRGPGTPGAGGEGSLDGDPGGNLTLVEPLPYASGITLSLDESRLFVAADREIHAFKLDATGKPSDPTPFIALDSDGMALDCAGNLYLTRGIKVHVYDAAGQPKGEIAFFAGLLNVAFGGPDRKTLFVTTTRGLRSVQLNVPGLPY